MSNRAVGLAFLGISAVLYSARLIAASAYTYDVDSPYAFGMETRFEIVGGGVLLLAILSALLGCVYFGTAEFSRLRSRAEPAEGPGGGVEPR